MATEDNNGEGQQIDNKPCTNGERCAGADGSRKDQ